MTNADSTAPRYSILVATLNEAATIEACIRRILAVYPQECEVLVVNGGTDQTGDIVERMAAAHPAVRHIRNRDDLGKGQAIRLGISCARAPIHAQIDADLQFLPEELPRVIGPVISGDADIVLGSRFTGGSTRLPGGTPLIRSMGNRLISGYASLLFAHRMTDVQAGMKAWSAQAIQRLDLRSDNYSYEVEIAAKGLLAGLRIVDIPVTADAREAGRSNVKPLKAGVALLRDIALFRLGLR